MPNRTFGNGKGGKSWEDRQRANKIRNLTLNEIEKILKGKDKEYKKALILRLATTILPRINELQGEGGEPFEIIIRMKDATENSGASSKAV